MALAHTGRGHAALGPAPGLTSQLKRCHPGPSNALLAQTTIIHMQASAYIIHGRRRVHQKGADRQSLAVFHAPAPLSLTTAISQVCSTHVASPQSAIACRVPLHCLRSTCRNSLELTLDVTRYAALDLVEYDARPGASDRAGGPDHSQTWRLLAGANGRSADRGVLRASLAKRTRQSEGPGAAPGAPCLGAPCMGSHFAGRWAVPQFAHCSPHAPAATLQPR